MKRVLEQAESLKKTEAYDELQTAARLMPNSAEIHSNLGSWSSPERACSPRVKWTP